MATQKDSFTEEASAFGERAKGAIKDAAGAVTGNRSLEREGERENAEGRARQQANDWVTGTFSDRNSAERAYNSMTDRGYERDDINLMMSDDTRKKYFADSPSTELGSKAMEGAGAGAAIGGVAGGIVAAIAAIGTTAVLGPGILIAGPLLAGLAGVGAGGATGGIIGALIGSGIPKERAELYDSDIKNGGIVMGVNPRTKDDASYFEKEWKGYNGRNIYR